MVGEVDPFNVPLVDDVLMNELQLCVDLIVAANASRGRMSQAEIDGLLQTSVSRKASPTGAGETHPLSARIAAVRVQLCFLPRGAFGHAATISAGLQCACG